MADVAEANEERQAWWEVDEAEHGTRQRWHSNGRTSLRGVRFSCSWAAAGRRKWTRRYGLYGRTSLQCHSPSYLRFASLLIACSSGTETPTELPSNAVAIVRFVRVRLLLSRHGLLERATAGFQGGNSNAALLERQTCFARWGSERALLERQAAAGMVEAKQERNRNGSRALRGRRGSPLAALASH